VPGVISASIASTAPFSGGFLRSVTVEGKDDGKLGQGRMTLASSVMPGYLQTTGIRLLRGRDFVPHDAAGTPRVAIVNETMASRYWPGEDAVGKRFRFLGDAVPHEVIGIARTANYLVLGEDPRPNVYTSLLQAYWPLMTVHARVSGDDVQAAAVLKKELRALEPDLVIEGNAMRRVIRNTLWQPRLLAALLTAFGGLALALTLVGLYGVIAYAVQLQRRELGIRMALGASGGQVQRAIVFRGLRLAAIGLTIGCVLALAAMRGLARVDAAFRPSVAGEEAMLAAIPIVLALAAAAASWIPARRAVRIDPAIALRAD
jgi:hypothetical protein